MIATKSFRFPCLRIATIATPAAYMGNRVVMACVVSGTKAFHANCANYVKITVNIIKYMLKKLIIFTKYHHIGNLGNCRQYPL